VLKDVILDRAQQFVVRVHVKSAELEQVDQAAYVSLDHTPRYLAKLINILRKHRSDEVIIIPVVPKPEFPCGHQARDPLAQLPLLKGQILGPEGLMDNLWYHRRTPWLRIIGS
jgi:hypothetical protein